MKNFDVIQLSRFTQREKTTEGFNLFKTYSAAIR